MVAIFLTFVLMLTVLAASAMLARKLVLAPAIIFLVVGIGLAFLPGFPPIAMQPEGVLLIVLPPLIYSAGVSMSWREFRANLRPIALLAIGCVIFTTALVAAAAHWALGLPWSVGFVLGAIVSPPDAVAATAIGRSLSIPRRIVTILEGESLVNDASALVLYRAAVAATVTGSFLLRRAALDFVIAAVLGIVVGLLVGWVARLALANPRTGSPARRCCALNSRIPSGSCRDCYPTAGCSCYPASRNSAKAGSRWRWLWPWRKVASSSAGTFHEDGFCISPWKTRRVG